MIDWQDFRKQILAAQNHTYLKSAAAGPLHPAAFDCAQKTLSAWREHGDTAWPRYERELIDARAEIANFIGASVDELAFVTSTSLAMNLFAMHLRQLNPNRTVSILAPDLEFPSTTLPWIKQGCILKLIKDDGTARYTPQIVEQALKVEKPTALAMSHVQYSTGFRADIFNLRNSAASQNSVFILNATQSLGAFDVDAASADFVCASTHKWLMAGYGLCIVKISKKFLNAPLPIHGWLSQKAPWTMNNQTVDPIPSAQALEVGVGPMLNILCVAAVARWIREHGGVRMISERILHLVAFAKSALKKAGVELAFDFEPSESSGILILKTKYPASELEASLAAKNIFVSARPTGLRIALHWFNDEEDIRRLISALS